MFFRCRHGSCEGTFKHGGQCRRFGKCRRPAMLKCFRMYAVLTVNCGQVRKDESKKELEQLPGVKVSQPDAVKFVLRSILNQPKAPQGFVRAVVAIHIPCPITMFSLPQAVLGDALEASDVISALDGEKRITRKLVLHTKIKSSPSFKHHSRLVSRQM